MVTGFLKEIFRSLGLFDEVLISLFYLATDFFSHNNVKQTQNSTIRTLLLYGCAQRIKPICQVTK